MTQLQSSQSEMPRIETDILSQYNNSIISISSDSDESIIYIPDSQESYLNFKNKLKTNDEYYKNRVNDDFPTIPTNPTIVNNPIPIENQVIILLIRSQV